MQHRAAVRRTDKYNFECPIRGLECDVELSNATFYIGYGPEETRFVVFLAANRPLVIGITGTVSPNNRDTTIADPFSARGFVAWKPPAYCS
jgi:hypothetical protein